MTNALVNLKKNCSLPLVWIVSLEASLDNKSKKGFFRLKQWRISRKAKYLIAVAIVAVLLISAFAFLPKQVAIIGNVAPQNGDNSTSTPTSTTTATPTPSPTSASQANGSNDQNFNQFLNSIYPNLKAPGLIEPGQPINNATWMQVATYAWAYFQPGVGVDNTTGLPYAEAGGFTDFTDWDLGCYIQAVIDAQEIGLIDNNNASWDFSARMNDVLTFLENRTLDPEGYPYQFYDGTTGENYTAISSSETVDVIDTGTLFVALNNLRNYNSSLAPTIDSIILTGRSNYTALVSGIEGWASQNSIYGYYVAAGFASFWPEQLSNVPISILNNIVNSPTVTPYGNASLPEAQITGDPLLMSVFELNNNSSQLMALSKQVYLASEAYYNATRDYAAFSEGNGLSGTYIYEWVVNGNATWVVPAGINPIIYNKVAFSFLALYNTTYTINMVAYLEQYLPAPTGGYYDGADNSGNAVYEVGSNTNSLILDAALYAIQNNT
jgi:hypothetical protein